MEGGRGREMEGGFEGGDHRGRFEGTGLEGEGGILEGGEGDLRRGWFEGRGMEGEGGIIGGRGGGFEERVV